MKLIKTAFFSLLGILVLPFMASAQVSGITSGLTYANTMGLGTRDIQATIFGIVNIIMGFLGIIAVLLILYGGFIWMTAQGSEEKITKARKIIVGGVIGLAIILSALGITNFVISNLLTATGR